MTNPIVNITVRQTQAPNPNTLQQTGAVVSQGGTTLAVNGVARITQPSDLTPILAAALDLASLTSTGLVATATLQGTSSDIVSGSYNQSTGLVSLTLSGSLDINPGNSVAISGLIGTGSYASAEGTFVAAAGTGGTTLNYYVATGLTMTITGGTAETSLGIPNGSTFLTTIAGAQPAGYNGTFLATVVASDQFTYALASSLSSPATGTPTFTPPTQAELVLAVQEFSAQGGGVQWFVLELGAGTPAAGVAALSTYIEDNPNSQPNQAGQLPNVFYRYMLPRSWDAASGLVSLLDQYQTTTSKLYFDITTTVANYSTYQGMKNVFAMVEAPGVQATEIDVAAVEFDMLGYAPSSTNPVAPLNLAYLSAVTPYPTQGNAALLKTLGLANVNVVGTAAAGGLSQYLLSGGNMMDGNPFTYWYSVDWVQITSALNITNALITARNSNNPIYYNQNGINSLLRVIVSTLNQGISNGLVLNPVKVTTLSAADLQAALDADTYGAYTLINADPFASYVTENPNDYKQGVYNGFFCQYTPLLGFESIGFVIDVSSFAA